MSGLEIGQRLAGAVRGQRARLHQLCQGDEEDVFHVGAQHVAGEGQGRGSAGHRADRRQYHQPSLGGHLQDKVVDLRQDHRAGDCHTQGHDAMLGQVFPLGQYLRDVQPFVGRFDGGRVGPDVFGRVGQEGFLALDVGGLGWQVGRRHLHQMDGVGQLQRVAESGVAIDVVQDGPARFLRFIIDDPWIDDQRAVDALIASHRARLAVLPVNLESRRRLGQRLCHQPWRQIDIVVRPVDLRAGARQQRPTFAIQHPKTHFLQDLQGLGVDLLDLCVAQD